MSNLDEFIDQEKLYATEGRRGVVNLCKIARALGYKDEMYFGQLEQGATVGDLLEFLMDNSGAIVAIHEWIAKHENCWKEELESQLQSDEDDEEQDDEE